MVGRKITAASEEFQHPWDRQATAALKVIPALNTVTEKILELGLEKIAMVELKSSAIKVTPKQFPSVWEAYIQAREKLNAPRVEIYIQSDPVPNAYTLGYKKPLMVLTSGFVDMADDQDLLIVIAHELGHQIFGHSLYHSVARNLNLLISILGDMGKTLYGGLEVAMSKWSRMSEFSADRAALLVCQDGYSFARTMGRLAAGSHRLAGQIDTEELIRQSKEFELLDQDIAGSFWKFVNYLHASHPFMIMRIKEGIEWAEKDMHEFLDDSDLLLPEPEDDGDEDGSLAVYRRFN